MTTATTGAGKRVVTIGEILVEIMAKEAGMGFLTPIDLVGPYPSGAPAIFIDQVGRLGQPAGLVSAVGDDDFGRLNLARLEADGVDVSAVSVHPDRPTGSAFVRYRPDGARDFVFNIRHSASGALERTAAVDAVIAGADHLHVMGTALAAPGLVALVREAVDAVKGRGGTISFDPNLRKEILGLPGLRAALDHVFARTDLFLPSGPELMLFSAETDEAAAIADILARGIRAVVVKHGADGASYHDRDGSIRVAGHPVTEVDPTGAGDAFGATFVTYWLRGAAPADALARANAAGALAVGRRGPMEGNADEATIEAFLAPPDGGVDGGG